MELIKKKSFNEPQNDKYTNLINFFLINNIETHAENSEIKNIKYNAKNINMAIISCENKIIIN